jgi:hypothetical protein
MGRWDIQAFRVEQTSPRDHDLDADEVRAALAAVPNAGEWLQHAWYQGSDLRSVCLDEPDDETWTRRKMLADAVWWLVLLHRRTLAEAGLRGA